MTTADVRDENFPAHEMDCRDDGFDDVLENHHDIPDFFTAKPKRKMAPGLKFGGKKSNIIVRHAGHLLPFPVNIAYEKFSDFSRHAEWTPNIKSSQYLDPQQQTKVRWTRETMGFLIGWTTLTTVKEPNKALVWKSVEGIKCENRVIFQSVDDGRGTLMIMSSSYKVPEKVFIPSHKMMGNKNKGPRASNNTIESDQIKEILQRFCEIVTREEEQRSMYFT